MKLPEPKSAKSFKVFLMLSSIVLLVAAVGFRLSISYERFAIVQHHFESIRSGDSRDSIRLRIGLPNYYSGGCGKVVAAKQACALEWVYSDPLAPINPHYYVISFSADGRVIGAEELESP